MRTLIIFNHPYEGSFCNAILDASILGLQQKNDEVDLIHLDKEDFNPTMSSNDLRAFSLAKEEPEKALMMLDKKVLEYKARLEKADHLVLIFPIWWMLMPALTKGFIDKVIFPAIAYSYNNKGGMVSRLWNLKRVTVITTMNSPANVYETVMGNAVWRALLHGTFEAIGITDCKWINFSRVKEVTTEQRRQWLENIENYFADRE